MKVYDQGDRASFLPRKFMHVSPGADMVGKECPSSWFDPTNDNAPRLFSVEFAYGEAEVDDELGKYMVGRGLVSKHRRLFRDLTHLPAGVLAALGVQPSS